MTRKLLSHGLINISDFIEPDNLSILLYFTEIAGSFLMIILIDNLIVSTFSSISLHLKQLDFLKSLFMENLVDIYGLWVVICWLLLSSTRLLGG